MNRIEEIKKQIQELQKELELEMQKTEIEYPSFKMREMYWFINDEGLVFRTRWDEDRFDKRRCKIGNVFSTEEKAEKELKKLFLLTRFRLFRDRCNRGWEPDFEDVSQDKYGFYYDYHAKKFGYYGFGEENGFNLFGYFKNVDDAERAIELFGDQIKRLFVEEENE